jgi:hypothetical protein
MGLEGIERGRRWSGLARAWDLSREGRYGRLAADFVGCDLVSQLASGGQAWRGERATYESRPDCRGRLSTERSFFEGGTPRFALAAPGSVRRQAGTPFRLGP